MNHRTVVLLLLTLFSASANCARAAESEAEQPTLETEQQKLFYAIGVVTASRMPHFHMSDEELALLQVGIADTIRGRQPRVDMERIAAQIEPFVLQRVQETAEEEKAAGQAFRREAASEPNAVTTDSGMIYRELEAGSGRAPGPDDSVKIRYRGTLRDGSPFDRPDEPVTSSLGSVVPCFAEGLGKMRAGGKSRLVCPPELAYGDRGVPPRIPPGATVVFEVELLAVLPAEQAATKP